MFGGVDIIFAIAILIMSVVVHEVSHGYAALRLGDRTAQYAGRLTLNPLKHLDPVGSIIVPAVLVIIKAPFIFGWARPVPYNPYNLNNQKWGPAMVAVAGPLSNFFLAAVFSMVIYVIPLTDVIKDQAVLSSVFPQLKTALDFSNFYISISYFASFVVLINLALGVFNLIPIPPLDGSKILFALLPYRWHHIQIFLEQYGLFLILAIIFFSRGIIMSVILGLFVLVTGVGI